MKPQEYFDEWNALLEQEKLARAAGGTPLLVFRLGSRWLALENRFVHEVARSADIHAVPHRNRGIFLGLMNLRGHIHLCFSLHKLLQIQTNESHKGKFQRMLLVGDTGEYWVFPVDEVHSIVRVKTLDSSRVEDYTKGRFSWQGVEVEVDVLDEGLLFAAMDRGLQ